MATHMFLDSNETQPSFRDWIDQQYLKGDIKDFKEMLAVYKSTINIALASANINVAAVTPIVIDECKDMIQDTTADLQKYVRRLDERVRSLAVTDGESIKPNTTEWLALSEEKESTRKGLQICKQLSLHIETLEPISNENPQSSQQPSANEYIRSSLRSAKNPITLLESRLKSHGNEIDGRLDAMKLKPSLAEDDVHLLVQLRETKESMRQCMKVVADAGEDLVKERANVFEDIKIADDSYGITVSTVKDLILVRRVNLQGQSRYVGGQMSEASYGKTINALVDLDRGRA